MKWLLATLNQLRREYEFEFRHVHIDHHKMDEVLEDVISFLDQHSLKITQHGNDDDDDSDDSYCSENSDGSDDDFVLEDKEYKSEQKQKQQEKTNNSNAVVTTATTTSTKTKQQQETAGPSLSNLLKETIRDIISHKNNNNSQQQQNKSLFSQSQQQENSSSTSTSIDPKIPPASDRSWETSIPLLLRERALKLRAERGSSTHHATATTSTTTTTTISPGTNTRVLAMHQAEMSQSAYERRCVTNDRDILNFLGSVLVVDFRHWISERYGDDVNKVDWCWCRSRASSVLPCACEAEGKPVFDKKIKQMYNRDYQQDGKIIRGSSAMVCKMRDAVDTSVETNPNKFWFRPSVMIRNLFSNSGEGKFELIDDLFTGCDITGQKTDLVFPATNLRIKLLEEVADFYQNTKKDFYDLLVESGKQLIAGRSSKNSLASEDIHNCEFTELPGLLPMLCKYMPRFRDQAVFRKQKSCVVSSSNNSAEQEKDEKEKFMVAHRQSFTKLPKREGSPQAFRQEQEDHCPQNSNNNNNKNKNEEVTNVLFMKLAQLFAVAVRSCRGLFCSSDLKWLRDNEPFLDEEEHLTIASDYQIPNALRNSGLLKYSEELQFDIENRRILPSLSLKEVEIRLVSVLAATHLHEEFKEKLMKLISKKEEEISENDEKNKNKDNKKQIQILTRAKERFTISVVDYVIWLFGRSLTSAGVGLPHHLTPGMYY